MHLLFLGTGAMVPTKQRNVSSVLLEYEGEFLLFDCGEGTQRQMNLAGYNRTKVRTVLLTHWHGDHVAGLIGLIQTIGNIPDPGTLIVVGPEGTQERLRHLMSSAIFDRRLSLDVREVFPSKPEPVLETDCYTIWATRVHHGVPTIAFAFREKDRRRIDMEKAAALGLQEGPKLGRVSRGVAVEHDGRTITPEMVTYVQPGRSVAYVMDTAPCDAAVRIAEDVDVLICESTFLASEHQDKAEEYGHLSAKDAATIAKQANVGRLVLTHFSQRYLDVSPHVDEAQIVFPHTEAAHDFLQLEIQKKSR